MLGSPVNAFWALHGTETASIAFLRPSRRVNIGDSIAPPVEGIHALNR